MLGMITVDSLTKKYGSGAPAVDDVSFTAATGRVTGFLGPNGAGKSTTMRIMVGLTPATSGTATIDGRRFVDLPNPGTQVGVLLDASAQHAGRTGREILTLAQRTMGLPRARVEEMLDLVSLTDTEADRRVRTTRSGCASAWASGPRCSATRTCSSSTSPPTASTRPASAGCATSCASFADQGGTVLLSSHLLHEIEVIADDIVVIGNGRIVARAPRPSCWPAPAPSPAPATSRALAAALQRAGLTSRPPTPTAASTPTPPPRSSVRSRSPCAWP